MANRFDAFERPQCSAFAIRGTLWGLHFHLQVADEVEGKEAGKQVRFVPRACAYRNVIHVTVGLELTEGVFLRATTGVILYHAGRRQGLVGHDHLEFVAVDVGFEQIQLHRPFVLLFRTRANEQEAEAAAPANEEAAFTETDIETEAGLVDDPDA